MRRMEIRRSNFSMKGSVAPAGAWFVPGTFPTAEGGVAQMQTAGKWWSRTDRWWSWIRVLWQILMLLRLVGGSTQPRSGIRATRPSAVGYFRPPLRGCVRAGQPEGNL